MPRSTCAFRIGQTVTMVDRRTGEPIETVRVAAMEGGEVAVEGYTARFSAADGSGIDTAQSRLLRTARILDMAGRVLSPGGDVRVPVRVIAARHDIRPATAADRKAVADRQLFERLATELSVRLADAATGRGDLRPSQLQEVARVLGHGLPMGRRAAARSA